ncbi:MAG: helix-turn-helix domain-containing protein [Roseibium album]|uniref:Nitrogen fixation regulation protein FixK n=1 Tax=Roseibium album TaxID=311410 RepID=A0A0M6ZPU1_9HYPH|nr:helix-turn-helix domain-containing protein [Roseibium album]CTQ63443.1 Nitrogen fixation regulation protein FixK [Roseibium album]CTQ69909.1 Nitrogen fixation regulation protein FixK [Roseibium album]CTQ81030.1 Nitrogen fixation regulation protein FixK [Roseibium album]
MQSLIGLEGCGFNETERAAENACGLVHSCGFHARNCICSELRAAFNADLPKGVNRFALASGQEIEPETLPNSPVIGVLTGSVGIVAHLSDGRRTITGLFFPGDYINLASLNRQLNGAITALAPSAVQVMEQPVFENLLRLSNLTRDHFMDQMNSVLFQLLDHSNDLAKKTPIERIAAFLFELKNRTLPRKSTQFNTVAIPFGRRDIADYLGLQPETVSRGFTTLTAEGVINLPEADLVTIQDVHRLRQIANGGRPRKRGV